MNFLRIIFFLLMFFIGITVSAQLTVTIKWVDVKQPGTGDSIYYSPGRKLTWNDFNGKPDASSVAAAITESGFGYFMSMQSVNRKTHVTITVFCYFNKNRSWVKKHMDNDYALKHEQHHFDITYINACAFIKKLKGSRFDSRNYNGLVEKIYDEYFEAMNKMQNDYDGQTSNGRIQTMQTYWNRKIDQQLAQLTD